MLTQPPWLAESDTAALQPASSSKLGGKDVLGGEGLNLTANTCIYQNQSLLFKSTHTHPPPVSRRALSAAGR